MELPNKVKLTVSQQLQEQIYFLCANVDPNREWSGTLFYTVVGELGDEDFEMRGEYLFLQDIGTKTYTEYEPSNPDFIKFLMENKQFMTYKQGHIHSHNTMSVFFSDTDTKEIIENSELHNFYLSLIVNNRNEMEAKVAYRGKEKKEIKRVITVRKTDGSFKESIVTTTEEEAAVYINDCDIYVEDSLGESFEARFLGVQEIVAKRDMEKQKVAKQAKEVAKNLQKADVSSGEGSSSGREQAALFEFSGSDDRKKKRSKEDRDVVVGPWGDETALRPGFEWDDPAEGVSAVVTKVPQRTPAQIVSFLQKLLAGDYLYEGGLLRVLQTMNKNLFPEKNRPTEEEIDFVFDRITDRVDEYYIGYFPEDLHMARFNKTVEGCITILEEYETTYPELISNLTDALQLSID